MDDAERGPLTGQVALVTGASSGIGEATARRFARAGASVALVARREGPLDAVVRELGPSALGIAADVSDPAAVHDVLRTVLTRFGRLDITVNSAGVVTPASLSDADEDNWRLHIDVNLSGTYFVAREAGLIMAESHGGTIVNIGSELSVMGMAMYVPYCASKAGVIGLTRALAAELAPKVTVNAICPGPVDTAMLAREFDLLGTMDSDSLRAKAVERVPLRRFATADEVAAGIYYLAVEAPYATGTTLELDGGTTAV